MATDPTSSSISPALTAYPRSLALRDLLQQLRLGRDRLLGPGYERLGRGRVSLPPARRSSARAAPCRATCSAQAPRSGTRHHAQRAFGLHTVDIADLVALETPRCTVSPSLGGQLLHRRPGLLPHIERADDGQPHLDQRRPGDVGPGHRLLLDETVVREHGQQPMRRRVRDAEIFACVGEPDPRLLAEQQQQQQTRCSPKRSDRPGQFRSPVACSA